MVRLSKRKPQERKRSSLSIQEPTEIERGLSLKPTSKKIRKVRKVSRIIKLQEIK